MAKALDALSRRILRILSSDSRMTATSLAEKSGCSKPTALKKLRQIEKGLNLRYIPQFNYQKLGLGHQYLVAAKTERSMGRKELLGLLGKSSIPQFAAICEGDFNLLIYAVAKSSFDYFRWAYFMRKSLQTPPGKLLSWNESEVALPRLGFFPLRGEVLDNLDLPSTQKKLLKELNRNARVPLKSMAHILKMTPTAARYNLDMLLRKGYIHRFTAFTRAPVGGFIVALFVNKPFLPDHAERARSVRARYFLDDDSALANRYQMSFELSGHADLFNLIHFSSIDEWYREKGATAELMGEGTGFSSAIILETVMGELPIRNVDVKDIYVKIEWEELGNLRRPISLE